METLYIFIIGYFSLGLMMLAILDIFTGRIRRKLLPASYDTQNKLINSGNYIGKSGAVAITIFALIIFWPLAIYGAITTLKGGNNGKSE